MDFLCPSCQKMLTVPDQYAGTLMKCPLCQNTFTAPALPPKPGPLAPAPAAAPPPPSEVYGVQTEASSSAPPGLTSAPPLTNRTAPKPPPPPPGGKDLHTGFTIPLRADVVAWIAPAALVLVFLLQIFFPWVGSYWTGTGLLTQGAWGATFGYYATPDQKLWETVSGLSPKDVVGMNLLLLPYLLLFLLALALAVASAVLPRAQVKLPPAADPFLHYRWALTAAVTLFSFLILCAVLVLGFSMEHRAWSAAEAKANQQTVSSDAEKAQVVGREYKALGITRTWWMRLAFALQLIAVLAAALTFWLDYRGPVRPVPRFEMRW